VAPESSQYPIITVSARTHSCPTSPAGTSASLSSSTRTSTSVRAIPTDESRRSASASSQAVFCRAQVGRGHRRLALRVDLNPDSTQRFNRLFDVL